MLIKNFTTFPDDLYYNLHESNINSYIKFIDLICDIYLITMSDKIFSNSIGRFIHLVRKCNINKYEVQKQFQIN